MQQITYRKATFEQIVHNPEIELYVATDNDKIVGFMTKSWSPRTSKIKTQLISTAPWADK